MRSESSRTQRTLGFDRIGAGPPLALLHPTGLGPGVLVPFAERLAGHRTVVIPHRRGYGSSATMEPATSLDTHLSDLSALIESLELGPCTLVGVSAGATIALAYAERNQDHPATILAHEPLLGPIAPLLHAQVEPRIARLLEHADRPLELSIFTSDLIGIDTWNSLPPAWRDGVETNREAALAEVGFYAAYAADLVRLGPLGESGRLLTSVGARSNQARHEAAGVLGDHAVRVLSIENSGHIAPIDAPAAFEDALARAEDISAGSRR